MKKLLLLFFQLLVLQTAYSQQAMTLQQVIDKALAQNLNVQAAQTDQRIAAAKVQEIYANLLPQISAEGKYQYYNNIPVQILPASFLGGGANEYAAVEFGLKQSTTGTVQFSQLLYNPSVFMGIRAGKAAAELSDLQVRQVKENTVYAVSSTFYNLQTISKQLDFVQSNLNNIEKLLNITTQLQQAGLAKKIEVNRLKVNQQNLLTQKNKLQTVQYQLYNALKLQMGVDLAENVQIDTALAALPTDKAIEKGNRTDLQMVQKQQVLLNIERQNIKTGYLPTLSAFGALSYTSYNDKFEPFGKLNGTKWYPASFVGVQLNWDIFDGFRKQRQLQTKKLEAEKLTKQEAFLVQSIAMETANAQKDYAQAQENVKNQQENWVLAQQNYEQVALAYKSGITPFVDVVSAETALREAQSNYLTELIKLRASELEVKKANGNLLNEQ